MKANSVVERFEVPVVSCVSEVAWQGFIERFVTVFRVLSRILFWARASITKDYIARVYSCIEKA